MIAQSEMSWNTWKSHQCNLSVMFALSYKLLLFLVRAVLPGPAEDVVCCSNSRTRPDDDVVVCSSSSRTRPC